MFINLKKYREPFYINSIAIMLSNVINAVFSLLFITIATNAMSVSDIGLATTAISLATLIASSSYLGMDSGLIRYLPESNYDDKLYSSIVTLSLLVSVILTIFFYFGIDYISPSLHYLVSAKYIIIFLLYIMVSVIYFWQNLAFISLRKSKIALIQNLLLILRIPLILFFSFLSILNIFNYFLTLVISYLICIIVGFFLLKKHNISYILGFKFNMIRKISSFSINNYITALLGNGESALIPIIIINTLGVKASAYYYVAFTIAGIIPMIYNSIIMSLFVEGSHNKPLKENVINSLKIIALIILPITLLICFFGNYILIIFNKDYSTQSSIILKIISISFLFSSITSIYMSIKNIQKDITIRVYIKITEFILLIFLSYYLLREFGLIGIGYAWLLTNIIVCAIVLLLIKKENWVKF